MNSKEKINGKEGKERIVIRAKKRKRKRAAKENKMKNVNKFMNFE